MRSWSSGEHGLLESPEAQEGFLSKDYPSGQSAWAAIAAGETVLLGTGEGQAAVEKLPKQTRERTAGAIRREW